jgi:hypothetical protein
MPIRHRIRQNHKRNTKPVVKIIIILSIIAILITIIFFITQKLKKKLWRNDNRLTVVMQNYSGDIIISDIDPVAKEIVNVKIPQNLEIDTAGNYGKLRIGKIWDLGKQEKRGGQILASSITSNMNLPVRAWSSSDLMLLENGSLFDFIKGILINNQSNLTLGDRIAIGWFTLSLDNIQKSEINLVKTNIIKSTQLTDGSDGYILSGFESAKLNSYFSDYYFTNQQTRILITDTNLHSSRGDNAGRILKILGGNVVSISTKLSNNNFVCKVGPNTDNRSLAISAILLCEVDNSIKDNGSEIQLILGNKYSQFN